MHPVLFEWGPFTFYSYGLTIGLGFLAALFLSRRRAQQAGIDPDRVQNLVVLCLFFGLLGARAVYIAFNWDFYRSNPLEVIRFDHGGLVFYGGLLTGAAGAWVYLRWHRMPVGKILDVVTPPMVLAHAIGRLGCFFNGCCYGKPTDLPWGIVFRGEDFPRHPSQIYESAFLFLLSLYLVRSSMLRRQSAERPGTVFAAYALLYGIWRFLAEFLRGDNPLWSLGLTSFQWMSIPLVVLSAFWLIKKPR